LQVITYGEIDPSRRYDEGHGEGHYPYFADDRRDIEKHVGREENGLQYAEKQYKEDQKDEERQLIRYAEAAAALPF
jgi:hypothetical protein